ncbi:MAG: transporter substrate-binding domain-containing protein [Flavobacteriales bacterium]|nr:transporter substrate-binding domain-containing protein [Flavobacteriales bacterium]MDG1781252.1 transporter substrate-binding domain-containing protein [Flavobacteriales bacterium]MDG2244943.1 transporter substrate-binding domain-containing protein [Flavobacteriales bacterium]
MNKALQILLLFASLVFIWGCEDTVKSPTVQPEAKVLAPVDIDLEEIRERRKLVLLTENSSVSYYLYRGQGMGYDYELVRAFAQSQGLELEVRIMEDMNDMFKLLQEGKGDIIACNLTVTEDRKEFLRFTQPLTETKQVLVQRRPDNWRSIPADILLDSMVNAVAKLDQKEVYVHAYSSFHSNILEMEKAAEVDINVIEASGNIDSEQLIRLVAEEQIPFTIADENMAMLNATYYDNLDVSFPISESQDIAWAVRKNADSLAVALDEWIKERSTQRRLAYTYKKYFMSRKDQLARVKSPFSSLSGKQISEFDPTIQRYSSEINWDWKLLAALIYQESRFNPEARSWAGAFGLMQLMPTTAERFGIDTTATSDANIRAGVAYLKYLDKFWRNKIHDPQERVKFILASYNAGPGHVQDAQRIAQFMDKNPYLWDENVAECLLLKSDQKYLAIEGVRHGYCRGKEPYEYVRNIMSLYGMYQTLEL